MLIAPLTPPANAIPIGNIGLPSRGVPQRPMMAGATVGPADGWATLADALAGASALTQPINVPMVAVLALNGRFVAKDVEVNMARPGSGDENWIHWNLEWAMSQAGPARVDWDAAPNLMAIVDNRAFLIRPGA